MPKERKAERTSLQGKGVLLTGAAGGLGPHIGRLIARRGARLCLAALPGRDLDETAAELRESGAHLSVFPTDLTKENELAGLVGQASEELGSIDVLINNAGVERMQEFDRLSLADIEAMAAVNLTAPMKLSWHVLPGMLERGWGRIINIASLAAKAAPPYAGPYAATKAGLIAFTRSLRAEFRERGVSASAVVPGFVRGAGMYHRMEQGTGCRPSPLLGTTTPEEVARAVIYALRRDACEVIVNGVPMRGLCALGEIFPDLGGRVARWVGADTVLLGWARFNRGERVRPPEVVQ